MRYRSITARVMIALMLMSVTTLPSSARAAEVPMSEQHAFKLGGGRASEVRLLWPRDPERSAPW